MDLSAYTRAHALKIPGKQQLILTAFAKALEIIPRQICDNAGLDSTNILNALRKAHASRGSNASQKPPAQVWTGIDVDGETVRDNMAAFVWEPALVKINAISSAAEAACLILSVDETVRNPQSEQVSASFPFVHDFELIFFSATSWPPSLPGSGATGAPCTRSGWEKILRWTLSTIATATPLYITFTPAKILVLEHSVHLAVQYRHCNIVS